MRELSVMVSIKLSEETGCSLSWAGNSPGSIEEIPTQIICTLVEKQNVNIFVNMLYIHKRQSLTELEN